MLLEGKRILLCVSGGIALYKALELLRLLRKNGGEVKVAMSQNARDFLTPLSFEALSGFPVLIDGAEDWTRGVDHISYASWAEICVLAPATINSLCKFAYGMADNVMLSTMLATQAPIYIAPSANTHMYLSAQAQDAITKLKQMGHCMIEPREDWLACGVYGIGAMAEANEIVYLLAREVMRDAFYEGKKVIISGGGSYESIDDVRCIANYSTGIQASSFALALFLLGAEVVFVSSQKPIFLPKGITYLHATCTREFFEKISENLQGAEYYFGIAALSDFIPTYKRKGKIKREEGLQVEFKENLDVLQSLKGIKKIGFKAEKDPRHAQMHAKEMLSKKGCECVCLNLLEESNDFGRQENKITLFYKDGRSFDFPLQDKLQISLKILRQIALLK